MKPFIKDEEDEMTDRERQQLSSMIVITYAFIIAVSATIFYCVLKLIF